MPDENVTKLPWRAVQRGYGYPEIEGGPEIRTWDIFAEDGTPVAGGTIARENAANMAYIVAACNERPALLKLQEAAERVLDRVIPYDCRDLPSVVALRAALAEVKAAAPPSPTGDA